MTAREDPVGQAEVHDPLTKMISDCQQSEAGRIPAAAKTPPLPKHAGCHSLRFPLVQQAMGEAASHADAECPISQRMLQKRLSDKGIKYEQDGKNFASKASRIAPASAAFPEKVIYPGQCGQLCRTNNTERTIRFHAQMVQRLLDLATGVLIQCQRMLMLM